MSDRPRILRVLLAAAALPCVFALHDASAEPVYIGAGLTPVSGTTEADDPSLAGTILVDTTSHWVSADDPQYGFPGAQGDLQSRVVLDANGSLDFYWRITVDGPSYPAYVPTTLTISDIEADDFLTGGAFYAGYRTDGAGTSAPTGASATETSLTWYFDSSSFGPGSSSYFLFVRSGVTTYKMDALAEIGVSSLLTYTSGFVPEPVPEPAGGALALGGLAALGLLRRRAGRA